MSKQNETKIIFSMALAAKLMELGHISKCQIPNPNHKKFTAWVFEVDETFYEDFNRLQGKE